MDAEAYHEMRHYFSEIEIQIVYFFDALSRVESELKNGGTIETFGALSSALSHAANLSRFFWNTKAPERCERLRKLLAIEAETYISLRQRSVRNWFDHVDETIDDIYDNKLWTEGPRSDFYIGNMLPDKSTRRLFNPDTGVLSVFERQVNIYCLRAEIHDLLVRLVSASFVCGGSQNIAGMSPSTRRFLEWECRLGILLVHAAEFLSHDDCEALNKLIFNITYKYLRGCEASAINQKHLHELTRTLSPLQHNTRFLSFDQDRLNYKLFAFEVQVRQFESQGRGVWTPASRGVDYTSMTSKIRLAGREHTFPSMTEEEYQASLMDFDERFPLTPT